MVKAERERAKGLPSQVGGLDLVLETKGSSRRSINMGLG